MSLYFVTGNKGKFSELKELIPQIEQLNLDLLEIQEIDPKKIIQEKIKEAYKQVSEPLIVEDTSLIFHGLNGLPGPLIKWFLESLGASRLAKLAVQIGETRASAKTIMAYAKNAGEVHFFEGVVEGNIVEPRGDQGFGWDSIFQPQGFSQTFAELGQEQKNKISHRFIAASKLAEYLKANDV